MQVKTIQKHDPEKESFDSYLSWFNSFVKKEERLICEVDDSVYHSGVGMSRSSLVNLLRSPAYYIYRQNNKQESTDALEFGSAVHRAVLEPEIFADEYVIEPKFDRRTKVGKEAAAVFEYKNAGKKAIKKEKFDDINGIRSEIHNHILYKSLIKNNQIELSAYATINNVLCRARADILNLEKMAIIDLKTTEDARPDAFIRSAYKYKYHVQAAFYLDVFNAANEDLKLDKFIFACVEKEQPHGVQFYVADPEFIQQGRLEYMRALQLYNECREKQEWPNYDEKILNLTLPNWAK